MRIRLLGGLVLGPVEAGTAPTLPRKTRLVLAVLALAGDQGISRAHLCSIFWPDRQMAQARSSLRQALSAIRRIVDDHATLVLADGEHETVRLALGEAAVDVLQFQLGTRSKRIDDWLAAAELYRGDLLSGVDLSEELDQWVAPHRRMLRREALELVERLATSEVSGGNVLKVAEALAERLLSGDPAAEEGHRTLMRIHQRRGRLSAALRQFEQCRAALKRELGVEPDAQTLSVAAALRVQEQTQTTYASPPSSTAVDRLLPVVDRSQPSVVVMPFDNLCGANDEYFVDGIVEEITAALSRVREFFVIARLSAFTYKGRFTDVREVGSELGVDYVVEGAVRRGGDRLRITVQLVDAKTRKQLWSDRYEGTSVDVFAFQDQIATKVTGAIHPAIRSAEIEMAKSRPPNSLRAYDLVMQAYPNLWSHDAAKNRRAISLLGDAITLDPQYGRAHALLAWCHSQEVVYLWSADPANDRERAATAVEAALPLIDDDPTALTAVGAACSQCLGDQERAAIYVEKALAFDPNNAWAWGRYAWLALYCDDAEGARERIARALALSPFDPLEFNLRVGLSVAAALKEEYAEAARWVRDVLSRHPEATWAYRMLASFSALAGDLPEARQAARRLLAAHPHASIAAMRASHPMRHITRFFDRMIEGLQLAGLPEA